MPSIQVPATVLAARIDRLPLEEKRRRQTAAVIGTEVPFALLRAIADVPEGTLHRGGFRAMADPCPHGIGPGGAGTQSSSVASLLKPEVQRATDHVDD